MGYYDEARGRLIGYDLGLETDEPPIPRPEDETILKGNMTFPLKSLRLSKNLGRSRSKWASSLKEEDVQCFPMSRKKTF